MSSAIAEGGHGDVALLRGAVDHIPAMVAYWDSAQRCRFANRAYERWFGVQPESLIGKHLRDLLGPIYPLNLPYVEGALRGEPQEFEREIPDPAGGPVRYSLASYIPDIVDGVVRGFYVHVSDVSAMKRAELARKRIELEQTVLAEAGAVLASSLNYKRTLVSIGDIVVRHVAEICVIDMLEDDDRVVRLTVAHADPAKAAACDVLARLSLEPRHTLGRSALETRQPQLFDDITPELLEAAAQDEEHLRALRELAPRSAVVVPLVSPDAVLGALVFASTRPHRYGAGDLAFATELARRATLAITNARLYEAAQRATRARDEVLGIVAHDVRSPLNAIRLAAELLARTLARAGVEGRDHVDSILRSVHRANRLIEDLLDVTRIDAGALGLDRHPIAVEQVLDDALTSHQLAAAAASIELRLASDEKLPAIHADRHRVLQVFENLIGNALKFTPRQGRITIAAVKRDGEILFSVADTGTGISDDNVRHVFDRFWQARTAEHRGAGLGLPICKGIIEAHGGRIWAESTLGRGTAIFFTLPATDEEAHPSSRHPSFRENPAPLHSSPLAE